MSRTLRTIHSSYVDLDPAQYAYAGAFDNQPEPGSFIGQGGVFHVYNEATGEAVDQPGTNPLNAEYRYLSGLLRTSPTSIYDESGQCDHCGARIRYVVVMRHEPTDSYMAIGETCFVERFGHADKVAKDVDRLRKRAAAERALAKVRAEVDAWLAADPANLEAVEYAEAHRDGNYFYGDLLRKLREYGPWSIRQRDAVLRGKAADAERAARDAEREAEVRIPAIEGRIVIEGEVVSTKWQESDYGGRLVFTVKDDRGFLVWGTVPSSIQPERGDRVRFTATVTRSDRDESFGFAKRPTKAEVIEKEVLVAA